MSGSSLTLASALVRSPANIVVRTGADALRRVDRRRALAFILVAAILGDRRNSAEGTGSAYKQRTYADGFDTKHIRKLTLAAAQAKPTMCVKCQVPM